MSIGNNAALGFSFPFNDNLSFFGELNGNLLNITGDTRTRICLTKERNDISALSIYQ